MTPVSDTDLFPAAEKLVLNPAVIIRAAFKPINHIQRFHCLCCLSKEIEVIETISSQTNTTKINFKH